MKRVIGICLALLLALSVFCPVAMAESTSQYSGTVYYVDATNGDNVNDGLSPYTAFKELSTAKIKMLKPGDAVLFKRGETFNTIGITISVSGTASKPITLSCYGDENDPLPLIVGRNISVLKGVIFVKNQSYIHIDSLHIKSLYTGTNEVGGVLIQPEEGNTVYGNRVSNCIIDGETTGDWYNTNASGFTGIIAKPLNYWGYFDGLTLENNEIYNCKALGISVNGCNGGCNADGVENSKSGKNIVISNNFLYNIGKDGILTNNCNAPLIEYNTCGKSHSYAKTTWHVAMWPFACYKALFQYNESYDTMTTYDGQGFDCDYLSYYSTFQYNYSHDNTGGFMLICTEPEASWTSDKKAYNVGSVVRYNISQNDRYRIFTLVHHITDTKIYNNTIYASDNVQHIIFTTAHRDASLNPINTLIYNNIFYTQQGGFVWLNSKGTEFKNNIVYGNNASLYPQNDDNGGSGDIITASGNIFKDPKLMNPGKAKKGLESCFVYKLMKGSPAIDAGLKINDDNKYDFFGNDVANDDKPNIGAYNGKAIEFVTGDSDFDGEVTVTDALALIKYAVKEYTIEDINKDYADINKDSKIDSKDILLLKKMLAKD